MLDDISKALEFARTAQKYFKDAEAKTIHAELMSAIASSKVESAELQTELIQTSPPSPNAIRKSNDSTTRFRRKRKLGAITTRTTN